MIARGGAWVQMRQNMTKNSKRFFQESAFPGICLVYPDPVCTPYLTKSYTPWVHPCSESRGYGYDSVHYVYVLRNAVEYSHVQAVTGCSDVRRLVNFFILYNANLYL